MTNLKRKSDTTPTLLRKQEALRHFEALDALYSESTLGTINVQAREILQTQLLKHIPELSLIEAIASKKCKTLISLLISGNSSLGIKTMNDTLIGYNLNNTHVIAPQIQILADAFSEAFAAIDGSETHVVISNNFKGIFLGTTITDKRSLNKIMTMALECIDIKMKQVLQNALGSGLEFWKRKQRNCTNELFFPIEVEASQRVTNIQLALEMVKRPDWAFQAHSGISRVKDFKETSSFTEIILAAIEAHIKALQGRSLARSWCETGIQTRGTRQNKRFCHFDDAMLLKVAKNAKTLQAQFFDNGLSKLFPSNGDALAIMNKRGNSWNINPDIIRLHRRGQFDFSGLTPIQKKLLRSLKTYLDYSRVFSTLSNFTYSELPQVCRHLEQAYDLLRRLACHQPLSHRELNFIRRIFKKDLAGHTMSEYHRASCLPFFYFLDTKKHRIYLTADAIDLGVAGRLLAVEELNRMADRKKIKANSLLKSVLKPGALSVNVRRSLYRQVGQVYCQILKGLPKKQRTSEVLREIEAARLGALTLIAGDEVTLSMHPVVKPFLGKIVQRIANGNNVRIAISEALPRSVDYHEEAMRQADVGIGVLKQYETQSSQLLTRMRALERKSNAKEINKLIRNKLLSFFAYVSPTYELKLYKSACGKEISPHEVESKFWQAHRLIEEHS